MEWLLIGVFLTAFLLLLLVRIPEAIRMVALQGALLSLVPLAAKGFLWDGHILFMAATTFAIKAVAIPLLLFRSLREAEIETAPEGYRGFYYSALAGGGVALLAFSLSFPSPPPPFPPLVFPAALSVVLIGFLLLVSRTRAVLQVVGFLVLENGIFLFGMTIVSEFPVTVEMGVLLDLLVGVFVMGIMIYHINRTFDHIDTRVLSTLKDTE